MEYQFYYKYSNPDNLQEFGKFILDEGGQRQFDDDKFQFWLNQYNNPTIIIESGHPFISIENNIPVINLDVVKIAKQTEINNIAEDICNNSGSINSSLGFNFRATYLSIAQILNEMVTGADGFVIDTAQTVHNLTNAQLVILHNELVAFGQTTIQKQMTLLYETINSTTYEQVKALNW